jgi:hypothetical protein
MKSLLWLFYLIPLTVHADMINEMAKNRPLYCQWAFEVMFRGIESRKGLRPDDPHLVAHSWGTLTAQEQHHFAYYFHLGYSMADRAAKSGKPEPELYGLSYKSCMGRKDLLKLKN